MWRAGLPALGCAATPNQALRSFRKNPCAFTGAASQPNAGQARSPQRKVLHFGRPGTGLELREGMVFTIEPMLNQGSAKVRDLKDGWTVVTKDNSLSAQWEHTVAVTADGFEVLTLQP